jgi:hypothetical protein
MRLNRYYCLLSLILLGSLSQRADSKEAPLPTPPSKTTAPTATPTGPSLFGMTTRPEGDDAQSRKEQTVKALETKPEWVPDDRKACSITIKPLIVNFTALTVGMSKKNQKINGIDINAYHSSFGFLMNRSERAGVGYDLELGIMTTRNIEIFTILGISRENPFEKVVVMYPPFTPPFTFTNVAFDFKSRKNFEASLGSRYYWNTQKPWFPFIGIMGTATFQGPVKAQVFRIIDPFQPTYSPIGPLTLQGRKVLWGGTIHLGADYQFNKYISLTLSAGLRYTPRPGITVSSIGGIPITFRDNQSIWNFPMLASLKITL